MPLISHLDEFTRGWLFGDFQPALVRTTAFEVCLTRHAKGELGQPHFHAESTEYNVIVSGRALVSGCELGSDAIFVYCAGEVCDVTFLEDTTLLVVRMPSKPHDKVIVSRT